MLLMLLAFSVFASNLYCSNSACSSFTSGYLYSTFSCLPLCPTRFTQGSNSCIATSSQRLFREYFWEFTDYSATSIGSFAHPSGLKFSDSGKKSPIHSKERGFYFLKSSYLVSTTNWVLASDFILRIAIKIQADGTIFKAYSEGVIYMRLGAQSGTLYVFLAFNFDFKF